MIHLAVHGAAGRMGERICMLAREDSRFELVSEIDLDGDETANIVGQTVDAVIDFSSDAGAANAARLATDLGAALLVGTTGLSRQTLSILEVAAQGVPVMVVANTSIGVAVLTHLVAEAARLLGHRYDVDVIEVHHRGKVDAPSGTALRLAEAVRERTGRSIPPDRMHAIRSGDVVGEHTVEFAGEGERIRLSHLATSRDLFARGALEAVAWLHGRQAGLYRIEESLGLESGSGRPPEGRTADREKGPAAQ